MQKTKGKTMDGKTSDGKAGAASERLEDVYTDAETVFGFDKELRPQDRAHAYLAERRVQRGFCDTAMLCACRDMVARAYGLGVEDGRADATGVEAMRGAMEQMGRALIAAAGGER